MVNPKARATRRRRLVTGVVALSLAVTLTGCGLGDTVNRAVSAIDQAIDDITVQVPGLAGHAQPHDRRPAEGGSRADPE